MQWKLLNKFTTEIKQKFDILQGTRRKSNKTTETSFKVLSCCERLCQKLAVSFATDKWNEFSQEWC